MSKTNPGARIILAATALAATLAAQAQPAWRCGNSYQQQPCPGGQPVQAQDVPSAADRTRNDAEVARQRRAADAMEKARLQAEKQAPRAPVLPAAQEEPPEPNGGQVFTARVPKEPKGSKAKKAKQTASKARPASVGASKAKG